MTLPVDVLLRYLEPPFSNDLPARFNMSSLLRARMLICAPEQHISS